MVSYEGVSEDTRAHINLQIPIFYYCFLFSIYIYCFGLRSYVLYLQRKKTNVPKTATSVSDYATKTCCHRPPAVLSWHDSDAEVRTGFQALWNREKRMAFPNIPNVSSTHSTSPQNFGKFRQLKYRWGGKQGVTIFQRPSLPPSIGDSTVRTSSVVFHNSMKSCILFILIRSI